MRISKERLDKIKARVGSHLRANASSYKNTATAGGVGGAAYYGAKAVGQKVQFLNENWWATPAVMLIGGHMLQRKHAVAGHALAGAAGFYAAMAYDLKQQAAKAQQQQAKGLDDAAALADRAFEQAPGVESAQEAAAVEEASAIDASDAAGFDDAAALYDN